ncbi:MAG: hypothetical protein HZB39_17670 [Planctomycetes bacterium]|nr:hypothetical protein [Planctomycetota bacterium]
MTGSRVQDPAGITVPSSVREGGNLRIDVASSARELSLVIPGHGRYWARVTNGVAEFRVPPGVSGGTMIFISDRVMPFPSSAVVQVVSSP